MRKPANGSMPWKCPLALTVILLLGIARATPAETAGTLEAGREMPGPEVGWSYLHFHAQKWLGEIDTYVRVRTIAAENTSSPGPAEWGRQMPTRGEILLLSVETKVDPLFGSNVRFEDQSWLQPDPLLPALWQVRTRRGRKDYEKTYGFTGDGVHRVNRGPADREESSRPPDRWSGEEEITFYPYPPGQSKCTGVTTPAALLLLSASRLGMGGGIDTHVCAFDRQRVYDVSIKRGGTVLAEFDPGDVGGYPPGRPEATEILFEPRCLNDSDKKEFSFLGISGDFQVIFDLKSGIPIEIKGSIPGFGVTELSLQEVQYPLEQNQPDVPEKTEEKSVSQGK